MPVQTKIRMDITVKVPKYITAEQFGVEQAFFDAHIRGKRLKVVDRTVNYTYVLAGADNDMYSIHNDDLQPKNQANAE